MTILLIIMVLVLVLMVLDGVVFMWVLERTKNTKASSATFSGYYELYKYLRREK